MAANGDSDHTIAELTSHFSSFTLEDLPEKRIPAASYIFLTHGADASGTIVIPHNVELITFNRPGFILLETAVKEMMRILRRVSNRKQIKSDALILEYKNLLGKTVSERIRVSYYEPNQKNVPNQALLLSSGENDPVRNLTGMYDAKKADIDLGSMTKAAGSIDTFTEEFKDSVLFGNPLQIFNTQTLVSYFSDSMSRTHPGKRVRLYLMCCRTGLKDEDEDMVSDFFTSLMERPRRRVLESPSSSLNKRTRKRRLSRSRSRSRNRSMPRRNTNNSNSKKKKKLEGNAE